MALQVLLDDVRDGLVLKEEDEKDDGAQQAFEQRLHVERQQDEAEHHPENDQQKDIEKRRNVRIDERQGQKVVDQEPKRRQQRPRLRRNHYV